MGKFYFLQINKIKYKAGDTNLGVFRTLMVSKPETKWDHKGVGHKIEKKGGFEDWDIQFPMFRWWVGGEKILKRDWDITFRDEEGKR